MGDERALDSIEEYRMHYEQETQKDEADSYEQLHRFCSGLEAARNAGEFFERNVDLDKFINYLAGTTLCQNWDGYNKNHFLVYNANDSKKWFILPWDLDRSLGDHWDWSFGNARLPIELGTSRQPGVTGWNRVTDRFSSDATLRTKFADRLQELLEKEFTPEKFDPIIDQMAADIRPEAKLDRQLWPVQDPDVDRAIAGVKAFIKDRREFLLKEELPRFRRQRAGL
jgi:spore coat protein CotH